jgi:A/G-specific adenine glycosylase
MLLKILNINKLEEDLLTWYDANQRSLPWRAVPGYSPNPYHVWLSEIMLQQTTVATVKDYFSRFVTRWPVVEDLAKATLDEVFHNWQGLGYYSRARNLHNCAQMLVQDFKGILPHDERILQTLPGIGPYTAAAIAAIAYDQPIVPVDGNVVRVFSRLFALETPLPGLKKEVYALARQMVPPPYSPYWNKDFPFWRSH